MLDDPNTQLQIELSLASSDTVMDIDDTGEEIGTKDSAAEDLTAPIVENPSPIVETNEDAAMEVDINDDNATGASDLDDNHEAGNDFDQGEEDREAPDSEPEDPEEHESPEPAVQHETWTFVNPTKVDDALHRRAHGLMPHILPPHRYWVAVMLHTLEVKDAKKEKDFVWLKGHGNNTVETIWRFYSSHATTEKFKLEIHDELPDFGVVLSELNFFNDNLVVFRAISLDKGTKVENPIVLD